MVFKTTQKVWTLLRQRGKSMYSTRIVREGTYCITKFKCTGGIVSSIQACTLRRIFILFICFSPLFEAHVPDAGLTAAHYCEAAGIEHHQAGPDRTAEEARRGGPGGCCRLGDRK